MKKLEYNLDISPFDEEIFLVKSYKNLFVNKKGEQTTQIKDRWNTTARGGVQVIRAIYPEICNFECGYCGKNISGNEIQIDHYLPSSKFNYLSYSLLNYVPSCSRCNEANKRDYVPPSIKPNLCDPYIIDKVPKVNAILGYEGLDISKLINISERLYNPFLDDFANVVSIEFEPVSFCAINSNQVGETTIRIIYSTPEFLLKLEEINKFINGIVSLDKLNICEKEKIISDFYKVSGYSYFAEKSLDYWINEKIKGTFVEL